MRYSEEDIKALRERWNKPLLKPGSFTSDKNGKVTGGEPQPILEKGWGWRVDKNGLKNIESIDLIENFADLLTTHLQDIKYEIIQDVTSVKNGKNIDEEKKKVKDIWGKLASTLFESLFIKLELCGLDSYFEPSYHEIVISKRYYAIDLRGAYCMDAFFDGANLSCAQFEGADCPFVSYDYANCTSAKFDFSDLAHSHFMGATCSFASFTGSNCEGASFEKADCGLTRFKGTQCSEVDFKDADCKNSYFEIRKIIKGCEIIEIPCDLSGAIWNKNSSFIKADISGVDWSKNPEMKRFIEQQQFVHSMKETHPKWIWIISIIDNLSEISKWWRWALLFVLGFSNLFYWTDFFSKTKLFEINPEITCPALSYLYFSVVTFTTLGFGDVTAIHPFSISFVMLEVILGYVFLGGLVTFLANWLGRR